MNERKLIWLNFLCFENRVGCLGLFRQVKFSVRLQHSVRFLHNSEGNLIYGKSIQGECSENALVYFHCRAAVFCVLHNSKEMKILYDWRGMVRQEQNSLNYFGARYLDPMLGMWISVDPARQFASPYLYVGNGYNPVNVIDEDGNFIINAGGGLLSVAGGVGLAVAQSVFFGKEFDYTPMDALIDFAFGSVGAGLVKKLGGAKDLINKAQVTRIEKHVTFKKSGAVATKHKWANRADAMEEQGKKAAAGALVGQGLKMGAKQLVKYAEDAVVPDPDPALVIKTGSENGSISPSDNTSTQLEIDK
ncbi:RHS repeat domain-containing protein [Fibrobacter sp.]